MSANIRVILTIPLLATMIIIMCAIVNIGMCNKNYGLLSVFILVITIGFTIVAGSEILTREFKTKQ